MALKTLTQSIIDKLSLPHDSSCNMNTAKQLIKTLNITPRYPIILVSGTNGKGSTCAYLTNILTLAGYKVGTYTSPHVFQYHERICINNQPINDHTLGELLKKIAESSDYKLGIFKTFTLAAHLFFIQQKVDLAIIEVGIGGKNDITNLFEPTISAITGVDYDHCAILGNTLEEIGIEKAGIYRKNKWAFYGSKDMPKSINTYVDSIGAKLQSLDKDFGVIRNDLSFDVWCNERKFYTLPYPALRGAEQVYNVALALSILAKLSLEFPISVGVIKLAILKTKLIGRFQIMPGSPQIIFDVAHNPQAVKSMLHNMVKLPFAKNTIAVFGIAQDKDVKKVIELSKKSFNIWHIAKLSTSRGLNSDEIKKTMLQYDITPEQIIEHDSIANAMQTALNSVQHDERIVCFGSFLAVEEAYKKLI